MPTLQNAVMRTLVDEIEAGRQLFLQGFASTAYEHNRGASMLTKMLVQCFVQRYITMASCELVFPDLPGDLKTNIMLQMKKFIDDNIRSYFHSSKIDAEEFYVNVA